MGSEMMNRGRRQWFRYASATFLVLAFISLVLIAATGKWFAGASQTEDIQEDNLEEVRRSEEVDEMTNDPISSVSQNNEFVSVAECPLSISGGAADSFRSNGFGRAWSYVSEDDLECLASALLVELRDEGWSLVKSEHLDLYGDAWGCVAKDIEGSRVLLVHIRPRILEISKSRENALNVSIVELSHG